MRVNITAGLLWLTLLASVPAQGAEEVHYELLQLTPEFSQVINGSEHWRTCGPYLIVTKSAVDDVVGFIYEAMFAGVISTIELKWVRLSAFSVSEEALVPTVTITHVSGRDEVRLRLNAAVHRASLPCLGKNTGA